MTRGRRTTGALAMAAVAALLAGCGVGEGSEPEPTPVVIPGSTVTIGTEPVEAPTTPTESVEPSDPAVAAPDGVAEDAAELVVELGAAMSRFETAHLSVGDGDGPTLEADHQYLGGNDFTATSQVGDSAFEFRRTGGAFYLRLDPASGWARAEADDFVAGDTSLAAGLFRWDVLADLGEPLEAAQDFARGGPSDVDGTAVTSYTFTVDAADVVDDANVPDLVTGPVEVTLSLDAEGLPVRLEQRLVDSDQVVRTDYGDWGLPVDVEVPRDAVDVS